MTTASPKRPAMLCAPPPAGLFMTLRDLGLWLHSARTDAALARDARDVAAAFEALYRADPDPYCAADPRYRYQARKYMTLLSFLPARRYDEVLELGCGLGAMCRALAPYAGHVVGLDVAAAALQRAAALSSAHRNISFGVGDVRSFAASGARYDLIVIADVLYYALPADDRVGLQAVARRVADALTPGGVLLLADHYFCGLGASSRRTRAIHDVFRQTDGLEFHAAHRRCFYLATLLQRCA